ncbi:MAG: hypothetical protein WKF96_22575 [Solirubrobacteraceae bacterium]
MRDRFVICRNPEQAERDKHVRDQLIAHLQAQIAGSDKLTPDQRAKLAARVKTKPGSTDRAGGLAEIGGRAV